MISLLFFFSVQAVYYAIVTSLRTLTVSLLSVFCIYGTFFYILRWTIGLLLFGNKFDNLFKLAFISFLDFIFLLIPLLWLYRKKAWPKHLNLLDAVAIGAALGLGYDLFRYIGADLSRSEWTIWPPGGFLLLNSPVQNGGSWVETAMWPVFWLWQSLSLDSVLAINTWFQKIMWPATSAWAALLALSFAAGERYKKLPQLPFVALVGSIVFLEMFFYHLAAGSIPLEQGSFSGVAFSWFYWLTWSGRASATFLFLGLICSLVLTVGAYGKTVSQYPWFRLPQEPAKPNFLSELYLYTLMMPRGWSGLMALSNFLKSRYRVCWLADRKDIPKQLLLNALDRLAAQRQNVQRMLEGGLLKAANPENRRGRIRSFLTGLLTMIASTLFFMIAVAWLGGYFATKLGPSGYFYATGLVSAIAYFLVFYKKEFIRYLFFWTHSPAKDKQDGEG